MRRQALFPLNIVTFVVIFLTVPVAGFAVLLHLGIDGDLSTGVFLVVAFLLLAGLLNWMRCPHCNRRLRPSLIYFDAAFFWQAYVFFGRPCPHCGRPAGTWWWWPKRDVPVDDTHP